MLFRRLLLCLPLFLFACASASSGADSGPGDIADAMAGSPDGPQSIRPDANGCPGDSCQIAPQCGCPNSACDLDGADLANGGTTCREVTIEGAELSSCSSVTACAPGYVCLGGQCRSYCNGDVPCSAGQCIVQPVYDSGGSNFLPIPGVTTCSKNCSPERSSDNGCPSPPQFGCHLVNHDPDGVADNGDDFYYTDCRTAPAAGGGNNAACPGGDSECRAGFECVVINAEQVCKQLCIVPNGACAAGTCSSFSEGVVIDGVEYGACL